MERADLAVALTLLVAVLIAGPSAADTIPLPEHPRPDFQRAEWLNLNGRWQFVFDPHDEGERAGWAASFPSAVSRPILVPFSWGSPLSGIPDSGEIGWYARSLTIPAAWRGRRVFVVFGASDWRTTTWLDGRKIGEHQGGYTPFSFELRDARPGERVTCRCTPAHLGRQTHVWDAVVTNESSGRDVALFRCTQMILAPR